MYTMTSTARVYRIPGRELMSAHYNYELPTVVGWGVYSTGAGCGPARSDAYPLPTVTGTATVALPGTGYSTRYSATVPGMILYSYNRENSLSIELKINESTTLK